MAIDIAMLRRLIEGALFSAPGPMTANKLSGLIEEAEANDIKEAIVELNAEYVSAGHAFRIEELAGGYRMLTVADLGEDLTTFFAKRTKDSLSRAALETLSIIAYKQPVTRAVVESIRGVAADSITGNLVDLGLVRVSGRSDAPGRPLLYVTTKKFLDHFGLKTLKDLPKEKDFS